MVRIRKRLIWFWAALLVALMIPAAARPVRAAVNVEVTSSIGEETTVQKGETLTVTYTYTSDDPEVTVLQGILTWDETVLERTGEPVPSDNLKDSGGWLGESGGNTVNGLILSGGYLPASASVTYQFTVLADCKNPASEISMKMTLAVHNASERYTNTVISQVNFGHPEDQIKTDKEEASCTEGGYEKAVCEVCGTVIRDETTAALGHKEGQWTTVNEGSCLEEGLQELRCERCGLLLDSKILPAAGAHQWTVNAATDADGWKILQEASTTQAGKKERVCEVCGTREAEDLIMSVTAEPSAILVEQGQVFAVTYTYVSSEPEVVVMQGILDWDSTVVERQGEPQVSANLESAYLGESGGNTVNALLLTGDYLPQTASVTYQFKALTDYKIDPTVISMKMTLGIHRTSERYTETENVSVSVAYPLTVSELDDRTQTSAKVRIQVPESGTVYYLPQISDAAAPDAEKIRSDGQAVAVQAGETEITLENLPETQGKVYFMAEDAAGHVSRIIEKELEPFQRGDVDQDGDIDIFDASAVIDMLYGREEKNDLADVNRDGTIDVFDASTIIDMVYGRY